MSASLPETKNEVKVGIFNSGWVTSKMKMVLSGGDNSAIRMPALFALLTHPERGKMLYDTGYHTDFYKATSTFPYSVMHKFTPAELSEEGNAARQLEKHGIKPGEIRTIIVGHGHVDHIPGAVDFTRAEISIDSREWNFMQRAPLALFAKGYIKSLYSGLPNKIETFDFATEGKRIGPFPKAIDLWGDLSMILVPIEGHTIGQTGLFVNAENGIKYFFIGDAAWICENYLELKGPSLLALTILYSYNKFKGTLQFIHDFNREYPNVEIVPCHCPTTYNRLKNSGAII